MKRVLVGFLLLFGSFAQAANRGLVCDASPYGQSLPLVQEREAAVSILGYNGADRPAGLVYSSTGGISYEPLLDVGISQVNSATELTSMHADLDGDYSDEVIYAGVNHLGDIFVVVTDEDNLFVDAWTASLPASDIHMVEAAFQPGYDTGIVLGFQSGQDVYAVGLLPDNNGGIALGDGQANMVYQRLNTSPRHVAIAAGDFLLANNLGGRDQIVLVTGGDPDEETVFYDLIVHDGAANSVTGPDYIGFDISVSQFQGAPLDSSDDEFAGLDAVAGRFGYQADNYSGDQLAVVMQRDSSSGGYPVEYWFSAFDNRNDAGGFVATEQISFSRFGASAITAQVTEPEAFALAAGDLTRDGQQEMVMAFAEDSGGGVIKVLGYRYQFGAIDNLGITADFSYPLSDLQPDYIVGPGDIDSIDVAVGDTDGDAFAEIYTVIGFGGGYDLRRWFLDPTTAEAMGDGCSGGDVIGSGACPGVLFLPFPDKTETPIAGEGFDFARFKGQQVQGEWTLCAADSAQNDTGSLKSLRIAFNGEAPVQNVLGTALDIPDNTGSLDTCISVTGPASAGSSIVETVEVQVGANHTWVGDLTFSLTSPLGTTLTLMNRPGLGSFGNGADLSETIPVTFSSYALPEAETVPHAIPARNYFVDQVSVSLPDWDGDSIHAALSSAGNCASVEEDNIRAAIFMPPIFRHIQDANTLSAQIGESVSGGGRTGVELQRFSGQDFSGYLGASLGGEIAGIGAEISGRVTAGRSYEQVTGRASSVEQQSTTSQSASADGDVGGMLVRLEQDYDCYEYDVTQDGVILDDSYTRYCELTQEPVQNAPTIANWNSDVPTVTETTPPEWTPVTRDWENLALFAEVTSSGGNPEVATDGLIDTDEHTDIPPSQEGFLQVDLGAVQDIYSIRLHIADSGRLAFGDDLETLRVFVYGGDESYNFNPAAGIDGVLGVSNILTVTRENGVPTPARGRYVRISGLFLNVTRINIVELQVFGEARTTPERSPVAVCDANREDGWFKAQVYNEADAGFTWIDMAGSLDWAPPGSCPESESNSAQVREVNVFPNTSLNGGSAQTWELTNDLVQSLAFSNGVGFSSRVGAEMDASAGAVLKINAGGGYEVSSGVNSTHSNETFWGRSTNVGGTIPGISDATAGNACDYIARPYSYRAPFYGNSGYTHVVMAVDYLVDPIAWTHATLPELCREPEDLDLIFASDFGG